MIRRSTVVAIARGLNAAFFLTTSVYCILSYSSFAYYQFIRPEVFYWPGAFVALHHVFFWLMWLVAALTLAPYAGGSNGRRAMWAVRSYLTAAAVVGVWLLWNHVLETIDLSTRSLIAGLLWLAFPLSLALVDHLVAPRFEVRSSSERRLFRACALGAVAVWLSYAIAAPYRLSRAAAIDLPVSGVLFGVAASGLAHLMLFTGIFLALGIVLNLARAAKLGPAFEYWTLVVGSGLALATVLDVMAFTAVGFGGPAAWVAAVALGLTIACVWSGIARHRAADRSGDLDALDGFLAPIHVASPRMRLVLVALLPLLAVVLASAVEKMDWDFLLQKLGVLVLWLLAFALMHAKTRVTASERRVSLTMPVTVLVVFWLASYGAPRVMALTGDARLNPDFALDRYAAVDPSFHFLQDISRANSAEALSFYGYLKANSTISRDDIKPVDIDLVSPLGPPPGERPHIFLFILDSLRRDYISPYNPRVTFTPAIDSFARESFVFDRAFTRYGATGLSVPSIWVGGMTLHIQYIRPFTPMNTLMKLLDAGGYHRMMGLDTIAVRILDQTPFLTEIDRGVPTKDYDFCRTLGEMGEKLADIKSDSRPVFGYTLPQNLHIANAFDRPVPPGESYPGLFERLASPVHKIDGCFGTFINRLKTLGLYDNTIVILTADHGDSLGEDGRFGHSYTVFPEVMRVPLIVHLPAKMAAAAETDLTRVSFLTDITPTLYALLGYQPADLGALYGSPLFGKTPDESFRRRDPFLLSSSYGAVYGMLRHNGRFLYIADAVEGRDYAYDLADGGLGSRVEITEAMRALNWDLIRKEVGKIADQYHFTPEP